MFSREAEVQNVQHWHRLLTNLVLLVVKVEGIDSRRGHPIR
jgi:hypothetical protein